MEYKKPVIVAENNKNGSFAAGCPMTNGCINNHSNYGQRCTKCERAQ